VKALLATMPIDDRNTDESDRVQYRYFMGKFLDLHGHADQAQSYYRAAAASTHNMGVVYERILAKMELRKRAAKP
ncbi:MAG: hypothetical protein ACREJC_12485, partial [Tepidisphaeraceae bacterium]